MAVAPFITGPHKIQVSIGSPWSSYSDLGLTDNDDYASVVPDLDVRTYSTPMSGVTPAQGIQNGDKLELAFTMVEWDATVLTSMLDSMKGPTTTQDLGTFSEIGHTLCDTDKLLSIKFLSAITGGKTHTFKYLVGRPVRMIDLGNKPARLSLSFFLCRPSSVSAGTAFWTIA